MRRGHADSLLLAWALAGTVRAPFEVPAVNKRLVLDVNFETAKDYDITSAYAVRGWNTTEGHMRITCPSPAAKHDGRFGMSVLIDRAFTKNFHAQFSLPHFMTRLQHSGYQLTFWAKLARASDREVMMEVVFLDVDEGYQWIGGAEVGLTSEFQHIAMEPGDHTAKSHSTMHAHTCDLTECGHEDEHTSSCEHDSNTALYLTHPSCGHTWCRAPPVPSCGLTCGPE